MKNIKTPIAIAFFLKKYFKNTFRDLFNSLFWDSFCFLTSVKLILANNLGFNSFFTLFLLGSFIFLKLKFLKKLKIHQLQL